MRFSIDKKDNFVIFKVDENKIITTVQAPKLKEEFFVLNQQGFRNIILDLEDVNYVDSSGLSAILMGNRFCTDAGGTFVLANASSNVQKLITISRLENVLKTASSMNEARELLVQSELKSES